MIALQGITRHFQLGEQPVCALEQINLTITSGEYIAVMGPSGSGKSTLLNVLGCWTDPIAATICSMAPTQPSWANGSWLPCAAAASALYFNPFIWCRA